MSSFEGILGEWMDVSLEATELEYHNKLEPFSVYKERVKMKGIRAFNDYLNCIQHGYEIIINKLEADGQ